MEIKKLVYSVILNGYDNPICQIIPDDWNFNIIGGKANNPFKKSRELWLNIHKSYPKYNIYLHIGGQTEITGDLNELVEKYLWGYDVAFSRHPEYYSVFEEAKAVVRCKQAPVKDVIEAARFLKAQGYDYKLPGLYQLGYVLRRNTPRVNAMFEYLSELTQKYCHREQLFMPFVMSKFTDVKVNVIEQDLYGSYFKHHKHEKNTY